MNKILREEMEYLIQCDDKAITPDVKDDVSLTLQYIDELENKIDKAIEHIKENYSNPDGEIWHKGFEKILNILRGDNETV